MRRLLKRIAGMMVEEALRAYTEETHLMHCLRSRIGMARAMQIECRLLMDIRSEDGREAESLRLSLGELLRVEARLREELAALEANQKGGE